jgi:WXG100 family type VII secretion target
MAVRFKVNPQELAKQAQTLQELNERFKTEVTTMTEKEQALSSMWEGEARNTFHVAFGNDVQQMGTFYNAVNKYVETLLNAAAKYQEVEMLNVELGKTRKY